MGVRLLLLLIQCTHPTAGNGPRLLLPLPFTFLSSAKTPPPLSPPTMPPLPPLLPAPPVLPLPPAFPPSPPQLPPASAHYGWRVLLSVLAAMSGAVGCCIVVLTYGLAVQLEHANTEDTLIRV